MAEMINSYIFEESMLYIQTSFDFANSQPNDIQELINRLAESEAEERGAVFTKREVVEFILDLVGYRSEEDLTDTSLLEPCFGTGDFLLEALKRLLDSYFLHGGTISKLMPTLKNSIRGIELHKDTFVSTKREVLQQLLTRGITEKEAIELSSIWLVQDDFLLTEIPNKFTYVVGNPPYVRQDLIPDNLISIYRKIYKTIFDRADLYIPFIERSLSLLSVQGKLGFMSFVRDDQ
jgi:type I restriction-modification system DNA methylase subunit